MTTRRPNNDTVISYDEILVRKYASAPIEWVDEQLRARHLDHARVICAVLAMREQHERCNEARRKRRTVARAVAAAIAIGMLLLATNDERHSGPVPPRSAVGAQPPLALVKVPESGWPTYRGNLERTGRPLGRSSITNVTVPEMT